MSVVYDPKDEQPVKLISVTYDTSALNEKKYQKIKAALKDRPIEEGRVTVTDLEQIQRYTSSYPYKVPSVNSPGILILEGAICGETLCGNGVVTDDLILLEELLKKISSGSFPAPGTKARSDLFERWKTEREEFGGPLKRDKMHNHLRDVMILCAHIRSGRDIFVTADKRQENLREELASIYNNVSSG